jgi:hypothetical protein
MKVKAFVTMLAVFLATVFMSMSCSEPARQIIGEQNTETIKKVYEIDGLELEISFIAGKAHNHPTFAVWLEDVEGKLLQTLFVTRSLATGYYNFGDAGGGRWLRQPGKSIRPAALPVWLHKREGATEGFFMPTPEQPVADAYTGPTPKSSFNLNVKTISALPQQFRIVAEVNQPWDWNKSWHNNRFPDNYDYRSSAQPSLIYSVTVNRADLMPEYFLNPIGHGHPSGEDGRIYTDISGHTSALNIFKQIKATIR